MSERKDDAMDEKRIAEMKRQNVLEALGFLINMPPGTVWTEHHWRSVLQLVQDMGIAFEEVNAAGQGSPDESGSHSGTDLTPAPAAPADALPEVNIAYAVSDGTVNVWPSQIDALRTAAESLREKLAAAQNAQQETCCDAKEEGMGCFRAVRAERLQEAAESKLAEAEKVRFAAQTLMDDVRRRYPNEELRCPFMRGLDAALRGEQEKT